MLTLKDHARNCYALIQYIPANMSGVSFSFAQWMQLACDMKIPQWERNKHPITIAYLIGLNSITGATDFHDGLGTLRELEKIIESKEIEGL